MRLRPWIIGTLFGAAGVLALPLSGALPYGVGAGGALIEGYRWLSVRQAVTLHSLFVLPPDDLGEKARADRAAGHYEMVCRACHGAPGKRPEAFAEDLTPKPPPLAGAESWRPPARVFVTLRDGVAHSAMPAWPAPERAEEIWDMVAFLEALPELSPQDYAQRAGSADCAACHDRAIPGMPRLELQTPAYLAEQLRAYRAGARRSGPMQAAAYGLEDTAIAELSRRHGRAVASSEAGAALGAGAPSAETAQDGPAAEAASAVDRIEPRRWSRPAPEVEELVLRGDRGRDIPACLSCHGENARPEHPRLLGQDADYLHRQLELFAELGAARGGPRAEVMAPIAQALSPEERSALARFLSATAPSGRDAPEAESAEP